MTDMVIDKNKEPQAEWTPQKALEFAVVIEKMGTAFYDELAILFAHDREIGEIFDLLALDEANHKQHFERMLEDFGNRALETKPTDRRTMPRGVTDFFAEKAALESVKTREDALNLALQLEQKTLEYYKAVQEMMGKNAALTELIKVEKRHVKKLIEYKLTGAKMRGLDDAYTGN